MEAPARDLFDLPENIHYLNCAYMAPLAAPVLQAGRNGMFRKVHPWEITAEDFFTGVAALRKAFARLLASACAGERVAVLPSVSYGFATVMHNVQAQRGQKIVTVAEAFPSGVYTWRRLADEKDLRLELVPPPTQGLGRGQAWNEALLDAIDDSTVVVSVPHVHWTDGTRFDLHAVAQKTRQYGAWLVIDGTQSVGALPFDLEGIAPDALICAGYKWLLGPYNMALAWYGPRMDDGRPLEESWMYRLDSQNFSGLVNYQPAYQPGAVRFSMGEASSFIHVPMQLAALAIIEQWGVNTVQAYCEQLSAPFVERLQALGCRIEADAWRAHHLWGVRLPEHIDLETLRQQLQQRDIYVSIRGMALRISCHLFNGAADFEALLEAMRAAMQPAKGV